MLITLTWAQWAKLKALVRQGDRAERALNLPIDLDNGDQRIVIDAERIRIQLED